VPVTATSSGDATTIRNDVPVRLRVSVHDALAARKGALNVREQAALHGIHRSTMFRLRSGERVASLELAMKMAADLDVPVEVLFERTRTVDR
jgi:DNA-binding XRE family transcriptional regulator